MRVPKENLESMLVTNILSENSLGHLDHLLSVLGNKVKCASDYMVIRSAGNMIYGTGNAKEVSKLSPELNKLDKEFRDHQNEKKRQAVLSAEGKAGQYEKKQLQNLESCKAHGGPLTKPTEVKDFVNKCRSLKKTEPEIKKALKDEVVYHRESCSKRPKNDPAFRIRDTATRKDLTVDQYAENLISLFSDILAVADVQQEDINLAVGKAMEVMNPGRNTCLIDSPMEAPHSHNLEVSQYVAVATRKENGDKIWHLGVVNNFDEHVHVLFLSQLGNNNVAFIFPEEDNIEIIDHSNIFPIPQLLQNPNHLIFVTPQYSFVTIMKSLITS